MKRNLAYIATAVVLGTVLMLAPIWLFPTAMQYGVAPDQYSPFAELRGLPSKTESFAGIKANQPADAISVSLMLAISLVLALGASLHLKERIPRSLTD